MQHINSQYENCVNYIREYNKTHDLQLSEPPQRHTVYSNIDIHRTLPDMSSYPINGFDFGTPNRYHTTTKRLLPYGVYVFDEAQRYWDSKSTQNLPPWVNRVFELRGHIFIEIYAITQKLTRLHSDLRSTVDTFTLIKKSVHTFIVNGKKIKTERFLKKGKLIQTIFHGVHFDDESEAVAYLAGDHTVGEKFTETHYGDIRENYDAYEFAVELEDGDHDFNYDDYNEPEALCSLPQSWTDYRKERNKKNETKN